MRMSLLLLTAVSLAACTSLPIEDRSDVKTPKRATLIVANRGGDTVSLIDAMTMTPLTTIQVGTQPHEVLASADGKHAYVAMYTSAKGTNISLIDVETQKELRKIELPSLVAPHGMIERNGNLYVTAEKSNAVARYNPKLDRFDWIGKTGAPVSHMLAVSPDESVVYTVNIKDGTVSVIPRSGAAEDEASQQIAVVSGSEGIALSPDGAELWVGSRADGGIGIVDTKTLQVVEKISAGEPAYRLAFSPDGRFVYAPRMNFVVVYDAKTRKELRRIEMPGFVLSVLPSPDGTRLYSALAEPDSVAEVDLATFEVKRKAAAGPVPDGIALSIAR